MLPAVKYIVVITVTANETLLDRPDSARCKEAKILMLYLVVHTQHFI